MRQETIVIKKDNLSLGALYQIIRELTEFDDETEIENHYEKYTFKLELNGDYHNEDGET
jgi:hypothetical protein